MVKYVSPIAELLEIDVNDIVLTSGNGNGNQGGNTDEGYEPPVDEF